MMTFEISHLVQLLQGRSRQQPQQRAYTFLKNGTTATAHLTYEELDQQAQKIAAYLQNIVIPGERALLVYPAGLDFITAFLGCLYAGIIAVPVHPPRPNRSLHRLKAIAADAQATLALTIASLLTQFKTKRDGIPELSNLHWIATDNLIPQLQNWHPPDISPDTLAFLQYTSGSTGTPKGVMISHSNLLHNLQIIQTAFELTPDSISVSWLPHYHDMGLVDGILEPLYTGCLGVLMPPTAFLQSPIRWLEAISSYRATHSGGPNLAYELCVNKITAEQQQGLDISCWLSAYNGAEPIRPETLAQFATKFTTWGFQPRFFYPCYGMAESTLMITGVNLNEELTVLEVDAEALEQNQVVQTLPTSQNAKKIVSCGHGWLDTQILIVNPETLILCEDNQVGEIWVSSPSVAQGYWNQTEANQQTFSASVTETPSSKFLRTGDLGFLHNGELFVTGRIKDVIIIWGRNHYPQDIEYTISQSHPALRPDCGAAFSINVNGLEKLVITQEVERSYLRQMDRDEIMSAIREAVATDHDLSVYAVALLKTASIPKTSSGKIQRRACREGFLNQTLDIVDKWQQQPNLSETLTPVPDMTNPTPTADTIQNWLITKLADVLSLDPDEIDPQKSFAHYSLDSSVALELTGELAIWLECELEPTLFWEYTDIESLTEYLSTEVS
ncbi:AMP-binding protein [Cronbergia sp. UHCC 0137]|uniref:AMP-binding protein n=1 Tax=Cronbergia sp. UHCC 0137 TaxID=3110239 RepID=UPI002B21E8D2|nr:AMP-binding protein [Cronbergia sp. UHCC 0137]MEA5620133.1 AMP-binding protein [Cronbergia sp. UHCC 0137]